jgi:hypothetical protein
MNWQPWFDEARNNISRSLYATEIHAKFSYHSHEVLFNDSYRLPRAIFSCEAIMFWKEQCVQAMSQNS